MQRHNVHSAGLSRGSRRHPSLSTHLSRPLLAALCRVCLLLVAPDYSPLDAEVVKGLREWSDQHLGRWDDALADAAALAGDAHAVVPASSSSSAAPSSVSGGGSSESSSSGSSAVQFSRQLSSLRKVENLDLTCRVLAVNDETRQLLVWDGTDVQPGLLIGWLTTRTPARIA